MVERLFLSRFRARAFDGEKESRRPEAFADLVALFRATNDEQQSFVSGLAESDLERRFELPFLKSEFTLADGLTQVALHGQNHRGQCLMRLRESGAKPPTLDYIFWARDRPSPSWPQEVVNTN
jgi:uncharacterized damage-inducible protein DinB